MADRPQVRTKFELLDPEQQVKYTEVQRIVSEIAHSDPNGLMYLLNAVALINQDALLFMDVWSTEAMEGHLDSRDLAGVIFERPLGIPKILM